MPDSRGTSLRVALSRVKFREARTVHCHLALLLWPEPNKTLFHAGKALTFAGPSRILTSNDHITIRVDSIGCRYGTGSTGILPDSSQGGSLRFSVATFAKWQTV